MPRKTAVPPQTQIEQIAPAATAKPSKFSEVLDLLQREEGATLAELVKATSWQSHTTRAALTGLRKKGHMIEKWQREGVTTYRIVGAG